MLVVVVDRGGLDWFPNAVFGRFFKLPRHGARVPSLIAANDGFSVRVFVIEDPTAAVVPDAVAPFVEFVGDVEEVEELRVEVLEEDFFGDFLPFPGAEVGVGGPGGCWRGCECDGFGGLDARAVGAEGAVGDHGADGALGVVIFVVDFCFGV